MLNCGLVPPSHMSKFSSTFIPVPFGSFSMAMGSITCCTSLSSHARPTFKTALCLSHTTTCVAGAPAAMMPEPPPAFYEVHSGTLAHHKCIVHNRGHRKDTNVL